MLFANMKALVMHNLLKYEDLGLDMAKFKADLEDKKIAMKVDNDQAAAVALGARNASLFVNGVKLSGAKPFDDFAEIDKQLAKAKELEEGTSAPFLVRWRYRGATATNFVKYMIDEKAALKKAAKKTPPKKQEDTKTVWKLPVDLTKEYEGTGVRPGDHRRGPGF